MGSYWRLARKATTSGYGMLNSVDTATLTGSRGFKVFHSARMGTFWRAEALRFCYGIRKQGKGYANASL